MTTVNQLKRSILTAEGFPHSAAVYLVLRTGNDNRPLDHPSDPILCDLVSAVHMSLFFKAIYANSLFVFLQSWTQDADLDIIVSHLSFIFTHLMCIVLLADNIRHCANPEHIRSG